MAILRFMSIDMPFIANLTTTYCNLLIEAQACGTKDLARSISINKEISDFFSSVHAKYNINFGKLGSGITYQIILENYTFPGSLLIRTDSCNPKMIV